MLVFVLGAIAFVILQRRGKDSSLLAERLRTQTELEASTIEA